MWWSLVASSLLPLLVLRRYRRGRAPAKRSSAVSLGEKRESRLSRLLRACPLFVRACVRACVEKSNREEDRLDDNDNDDDDDNDVDNDPGWRCGNAGVWSHVES